MKTILIIGASSFVGSNLATFLKDDFKVVGTYHSNKVSIPGVLTVPCDIINKDELQYLLFTFRPDITIYSVGLSSISDCAENDHLADSLNTNGLLNVSECCQRYKSQLCYISSAYVFGGENKIYRETDIPDVTTIYGKTKASAEFFIQKTSLNYIIFRTCLFYGRGIVPRQRSWFEELQKRVRANESFNCDSYVHNGFLDIYYLGMIMKLCFEQNVTNRLFQINSKDVSTYYDFAKNYCEIFGESSSSIIKGKWPFPYTSTYTGSKNTSGMYFNMDITNIQSYLNIEMPTIKESLKFTLKRLFGRTSKERRKTKSEDINYI